LIYFTSFRCRQRTYPSTTHACPPIADMVKRTTRYHRPSTQRINPYMHMHACTYILVTDYSLSLSAMRHAILHFTHACMQMYTCTIHPYVQNTDRAQVLSTRAHARELTNSIKLYTHRRVQGVVHRPCALRFTIFVYTFGHKHH